MKKIKIGVFGAGRGIDIAINFMMLDCDIVAVCDFNDQRLEASKKHIGINVAFYSDFNEFINHNMDAVIVANYFHEHAPYVIKCFEKGIHVFCECISNGTMAEGVELIRAFEKSNSIFFMAENYPQMIFNREMQRVVNNGSLGEVLYAEGEYNHPVDPYDADFNKTYNYFPLHWRNFLPSSYYITHSLGPLIKATGAIPKRVSCFNVFSPEDRKSPTADYNGDAVSVITTQNHDGSVFKFTGCARFGGAHNAYRICGTKGSVENLRGMGNKIMLRYNEWEKPKFADEITLYDPKWNDADDALIEKSGHNGADYITARMFLESVSKKRQPEPPFDLYSAVTMSSVGILAHRSMLEGGVPYDIPDFKNEQMRKQYEDDRLTPFYGTDGSTPTISCCSNGDYKPNEEQIKLYKELLKD